MNSCATTFVEEVSFLASKRDLNNFLLLLFWHSWCIHVVLWASLSIMVWVWTAILRLLLASIFHGSFYFLLPFGRFGSFDIKIRYWTSKAIEFYALVDCLKPDRNLVNIQIKWTPPPLGWFKLSSNGSSKGNPGKVGGGGLIRNSGGIWISGYARNIGSASSVLIELWALRDGFGFALSLGLAHLIVELDALVVVYFLDSFVDVHPVLWPLVDDYMLLLPRIPNSLVQHAYREANKSVDALARLGHALSSDFVGLSFSPSWGFGRWRVPALFLFFSFMMLSLFTKKLFFLFCFESKSN